MVNSVLLFTSPYLEMQMKNDWSEFFLFMKISIYEDGYAKWRMIVVVFRVIGGFILSLTLSFRRK